jgi:hypothetical protein
MTIKRVSILFLFILFIVIFSLLIPLPASHAQISGTTVVKLYSGDKLVATWENALPGSVVGNAYVFRHGTFEREVRISGTYSVEVVK